MKVAMRTNKILAAVLAIVISLSCCLVSFAEDDTETTTKKTTDSTYNGQIRGVNFNDLSNGYATVEFSGSVNADDITSAKIDDFELTSPSVEENYTKAVYIMIDVSNSMKNLDNDTIKSILCDYIDDLSENDYLLIATFGESEYTKIFSGKCTDDKKKKAKSKINSLKRESYDKSTTKRVNALKKIYDVAEKSFDKYDKSYCLFVTDGDTSYEESYKTADVLATHNLVVYGIVDSDQGNGTAGISSYIESSGGSVKLASFSSGSKTITKFLKNTVDNNTVIKIDTSDIDDEIENGKLILTIGETTVSAELKGLTIEPATDSTAPTAEGKYNKDNNSFVITFSERVKEFDGENIIVKYKDKDVDTNNYTIDADDDDKIDGTKSLTITFNGDYKLYNGEDNYVVELTGITDKSNNALEDGTISISVGDANSKTAEVVKKVVLIALIVGIPIIFLVALYLTLMSVKKKRQITKIKDVFVEEIEEVEQEEVHVVKQVRVVNKVQETISLDLGIMNKNAEPINAHFEIANSLFIGRDAINDLIIDDEKISSQHCVLEIVENGFAVTDLNSSNGTFVNLVPISSKTFINSGNKITIGDTTIVVNY